jgi:hypothetical protein
MIESCLSHLLTSAPHAKFVPVTVTYVPPMNGSSRCARTTDAAHDGQSRYQSVRAYWDVTGSWITRSGYRHLRDIIEFENVCDTLCTVYFIILGNDDAFRSEYVRNRQVDSPLSRALWGVFLLGLVEWDNHQSRCTHTAINHTVPSFRDGPLRQAERRHR